MPAAVVAGLLGVHVRTVRRWIAKGVIGGTYMEAPSGRRRWFVHRASYDRIKGPEPAPSPDPAD